VTDTPLPDGLPVVPEDPVPGRVVLCGRYVLEHHLASGGMGEVWRATDADLGRRVAVKLLHPHLAGDPDVVSRFRREARAAARLHHPSIVAVYDTCNDGGREAIVLQLIEGPSLRQYLDRVRRLTEDQAITIAISVAEGLGVAHAAGLVHRDIKPANILFGDQRAMVTDFGVAKALDEVDATTTGTLLGSVRYLCPEQVEGTTPDGRGDLYSLGVVLYECLTGTTPWQGASPAATALARLDQPLVPARQLNPAMSAGFGHVITTLLARAPDDRYPNAAALIAALEALRCGGTPTGGSSTSATAGTVPAWMADPTEAASVPLGATHDAADDVTDDEFADDDFADDDWHQWNSINAARRRRRTGHIVTAFVVMFAIAVIVALVGDADGLGLLPGR
jgi:eukaryotic-like serine/threonine-protein kinase